jgi:hypothetical protein
VAAPLKQVLGFFYPVKELPSIQAQLDALPAVDDHVHEHIDDRQLPECSELAER